MPTRRNIERVETIRKLDDAIVAGVQKAKDNNLTKPFDIAVCVLTALDAAGFRVVRKAGK